MRKLITIKLCRVCEKSHAGPLRAPVHLVRLNGTLVLFDILGEAVCLICRTHWRRERNGAGLVG